jgi:hypothetical protein
VAEVLLFVQTAGRAETHQPRFRHYDLSVGARWEGDSSGRGVGDAAAFAPGAEQLVEAMRKPAWVAEEPDVHLLPRLEAACRDLPLELKGVHTAEAGRFDVELAWRGTDSVGEMRRAVYALLGSVAETVTYVRQRRSDGALVFDFVTGMGGDDSPFAPHGHAVCLRVELE